MRFNKEIGFTLLEILVTLFIFTFVAVILTTALHTMLSEQKDIEIRANRLAALQLALIVVSNDLQQMANRPILNNRIIEEPAVLGKSDEITFTRTGFINPLGQLHHATLQRVRYVLDKKHFMRVVWPVLDQSPDTKPSERIFLDDVMELHFNYLDENNRFQESWPPPDKSHASGLPRAIRISLTLKKWGKITQLYLIPSTISVKKNA